MSREPFTDLKPPKAPPALRQRVLRAARRAAADAAAETSPLDRLIDRLWGSRPLRLGFAAAVVLLLVAHLGVRLEPREDLSAAHRQQSAASVLTAELGLEPRGWPSLPATTLATWQPTHKLEELGL